jgi:hypothetical protein
MSDGIIVGTPISTPIVPVATPDSFIYYEEMLPYGQELGLSLDRYQEIMHLPIAAFNGLNKPDEEPVYQCSTIWKESERRKLAEFLAKAEEKREDQLAYHISPKHDVDERHIYTNVIELNWKHLVALGKRVLTDISLGYALSHGSESAPNDPVTITVSTTVTEASELAVFHYGTNKKIRPSRVEIAGGVATIKVPRARLVKLSLLDDREDHLSYYENDNFVTHVDVKRDWTDPSQGIEFVWLPSQGITCPHGCTELTQTGCGHVVQERGYRIATISVTPATWSGQTPTSTYFRAVGGGIVVSCGIDPALVRVSYLSGRRSSISTEILTARLAHTLMPYAPCSCPTVHLYWKEDRTDTKTWTPYGSKHGAVQAWVEDSQSRIGAGGIFA